MEVVGFCPLGAWLDAHSKPNVHHIHGRGRLEWSGSSFCLHYTCAPRWDEAKTSSPLISVAVPTPKYLSCLHVPSMFSSSTPTPSVGHSIYGDSLLGGSI